jgi:hypothetical protein
MKHLYRIVVMISLVALVFAVAYDGCQDKHIGDQLGRLNQHIDFFREQIPMSLLGH